MINNDNLPVPKFLRGKDHPEYLLKNIRLVDPISAEIMKGAAIYVKGGIVQEVFLDGAAPFYPQVFDAQDLYLTPGLVDMHVHLVWDGSTDPLRTMKKEGPAMAMARGIRNAELSLQNGVTTLRDLGSVNDVAVDIARRFQDGPAVGPTVVPSGRIIQPPDGHVPDLGYIASGEAELLEAVRVLKGCGAALIKVAATGGAYGPEEIGPPLFDLRQLEVIVRESHRLGLKVAAHALGERGISSSVLAGIDTIEHGAQIPDAIIGEMVRRRTALVPTLAVYKNLAESTGQIPDFYVEKAKKVVAWQRETIRDAARAGVLITLGTDAGSPNFGPHPSVFREMRTMVEYGMTPAHVLRSATVHAAFALGMTGLFGTIEAGKRADAVLMRINPLESVLSPKDIVRVMKDGILL
ncbi:MAG: amidohydrolase family protein [Syntrophales bacterium]|nr:amidohydrolase family protein [Syntrophales bacterium]